MRAQAIKLTTLTEEEQQYAAEQYEVLNWCIRKLRVSDDDTGLAALGFLQAVKKWIARPELHRHSFRTIALWSIRPQIQAERKRENRQIKTVNLESVIPGTDDFTYGDTITYDNMNYLYRKESNVALDIKYDVKIPEVAKLFRQPSVEAELVINFIGSSHKTMHLAYNDLELARKAGNSIRSYIKRSKIDDVKVYKSGEDIYLEKVSVKKQGGKKDA